MSFFTEINGTVLLRSSGTYREAPIWRNDDGELFAKRSGGYVRLLSNHSTTVSKLFWNTIRCAEQYEVVGCYLVLRSFVQKTGKKAA